MVELNDKMITGDPVKTDKKQVCDLTLTVCSLLFISASQATVQLRSMEPGIMATLLHTTARSSPTTPSNTKML